MLTGSEPGGYLINCQKAPRSGLEPRSGRHPTGAARRGERPTTHRKEVLFLFVYRFLLESNDFELIRPVLHLRFKIPIIGPSLPNSASRAVSCSGEWSCRSTYCQKISSYKKPLIQQCGIPGEYFDNTYKVRISFVTALFATDLSYVKWFRFFPLPLLPLVFAGKATTFE